MLLSSITTNGANALDQSCLDVSVSSQSQEQPTSRGSVVLVIALRVSGAVKVETNGDVYSDVMMCLLNLWKGKPVLRRFSSLNQNQPTTST